MIRLLLLSCGMLAAAVGLELTYGQSNAGPARVATADAVPAAGQIARQLDPGGASREQWVRTVLARPLFASDRRPVAGQLTADPGLPRLTGIIASAGQAAAIFQPAGKARPVVAHDGETVAGWKVDTVGLDAVTLSKANDRIVLRPAFANGSSGTGGPSRGVAVTAAKAAGSRWETAAKAGVLPTRWSNPQLQP